MIDVELKKGVLPNRDCCFRRWRRMQSSKEEGGKKKALSKKEGKRTMKAVQARQPSELCNSSMAKRYMNELETHRVYLS